ncbi:GD20433 [Drosophila simulans]|nr:GD20433 [Drosophila simulans]
MAMKYRTLKETYKDYVGVFRSHIHGRGLYCTKDIEAGEMVIEYAGELIRSTLTDKRERYYDSRGIGCYMFKIDDNLVVDATMRGNAARFINHCCEPNCYSKVVDILGHKHIIIFALRRIVQGEELTYDYKFPFEDEKIPCSCGSKRCRKYLN